MHLSISNLLKISNTIKNFNSFFQRLAIELSRNQGKKGASHDVAQLPLVDVRPVRGGACTEIDREVEREEHTETGDETSEVSELSSLKSAVLACSKITISECFSTFFVFKIVKTWHTVDYLWHCKAQDYLESVVRGKRAFEFEIFCHKKVTFFFFYRTSIQI